MIVRGIGEKEGLVELGEYEEEWKSRRSAQSRDSESSTSAMVGESAFHHLWRLRRQRHSAEEKEPPMGFPPETHPKLKFRKEGLVAMVPVRDASSGNGDFSSAKDHRIIHTSRFFITTKSTHLQHLDGKCTILGEVAEGLSLVKKISMMPVRENATMGESLLEGLNVPMQVIRIKRAIVLYNPLEEQTQKHFPVGWASEKYPPEPAPRLHYEGMLSEEVSENLTIDDPLKALTKEEQEEALLKQNAKSQQLFLHAAGYLPDEDVAPPENVLFVCRLNPKTNDDDLELIFSQHGAIRSCRVVRNKDGESQGYAFIEYENKEGCEKAYIKMQNVVIDERRIVVDFAQSVAHVYWNRGRGKSREELDLLHKEGKLSGEKRGKRDGGQRGRHSRHGGYPPAQDFPPQMPHARPHHMPPQHPPRFDGRYPPTQGYPPPQMSYSHRGSGHKKRGPPPRREYEDSRNTKRQRRK